MAQEYKSSLGSAAITWATVSSVPVAAGDASGLVRMRLPRKALLKQLQIRLSGTYDQSVGAETQATEGNPALIQEIRLSIEGTPRRQFYGALLYELNRIRNRGAGPKTDPSTGVASAKAFSCTLIYDMGFLDLDGHLREASYLDLSKFGDVFLEIQLNPFNRYVSGNTQANMVATVTVEELGIFNIAKRGQIHFEARRVAQINMAASGNDQTLDLLRSVGTTRGLLLRVGTLGGTPILTAITALNNVGVRGTLLSGNTQEIVQKLASAAHLADIGVNRSGISLTAGYLFLDFAHNFKAQALIEARRYSDLELLYDITGTANALMDVYQLMTAPH